MPTPRNGRSVRNVHYEPDGAIHVVPGTLFIDGVTFSDIRQGLTLDCFFLAALAAVACTEPGFIEQMIHESDQDCYRVRFHRYQLGSGFVAEWQEVTNTVPAATAVDEKTKKPFPYFVGANPIKYGAQHYELWVPMIEKAYVLWSKEHNYQAISGGMPHFAMESITGVRNRASHDVNSDWDAVRVWNVLSEACSHQHPTAVSGYNANIKTDANRHAWALHSVSRQAVTLYNPHGHLDSFAFRLFIDQFYRIDINGA